MSTLPHSVLNQESLLLPQGKYKLHLRHIWQNSNGPPVIMFHGAIENGRIFYTHKGKGLACYLAQHGFNVYVADFRGRGDSIPSIKEDANHGQHHSIVEDIPALINFVYDLQQQPLHVICHSWGGVLFSSSLVRYPELKNKVRTKLCFGTKRQVTIWNLERVLKVSLFWKRVAPMISKRVGYLDAVKFKIGSDYETHASLSESVAWVKLSDWRDPIDDFDYKQAAQTFNWPPTWHITSRKDHTLGHAQDVQLFIDECNNPQAKFSNLSVANGNAVDYDHINILTHPKAVKDHFPLVARWLNIH